MTLRSVACAWCDAEMRVPAPDVGSGGYFVLPRSCRHCAGQNTVELDGPQTRAEKRRRNGVRRRSTTQKIRIAAFGR
jgi:hypothetical protein